jgi:chaperone required for assembly of F1-ATPase
MPLTGLAYAAIDLFPDLLDEVLNHALGFGRCDLVCYRAEAPQELVARQAAAWDPVLDWLRRERGIELGTGAGLRFVEQPPPALQSIAALVGALDGFALVALDRAAGLTSSMVLGLAMLSGHLDAAGAFSAAHVDENFQADKWGRDAQAEARLAHMQDELAAAERFLRLARRS